MKVGPGDRIGKILHLWFGIIFTASAPALVGLMFQDFNVAWLSALCGAVIILTAKVDALAELSLGPLQAKMQATIAEATATIVQLREIATSMATVVLSDLMAGQFLWGMSSAKRHELHDELIADLKRLGASQNQLDRAQVEWWKGIGVMYHNKLGHDLLNRAVAAGKTGQEPRLCAEEFGKLINAKTRSVAPPDDYEEFFKRHNLLSPEVEASINDYRHFVATKGVRRPIDFGF
jgi:hypothetical protein